MLFFLFRRAFGQLVSGAVGVAVQEMAVVQLPAQGGGVAEGVPLALELVNLAFGVGSAWLEFAGQIGERRLLHGPFSREAQKPAFAVQKILQ